MKTLPECRARQGIELRDVSADEKTAGYICALEGFIPFNSDSTEVRDRGLNNGRPFIERLAPDCFKRSLAEDKDIMGFAGHTDDPLAAFARIGENLTVTVDDKGMSWRSLVPDTQAGRDLRSLVDKKIIRGTSFEFNITGAGEKWEKRGSQDVRTITEGRLYTVNPVAFPAYPASELTVSMRSLGRNRRGYYLPQDEDYLYGDGNMTPDTAYAMQALGCDVAELTEALDYLRDNPTGALVEHAKATVAESQESVKALTDFLAANGGEPASDAVERARKTLTEAREKVPAEPISKPGDAIRERRRRVLSIAPVSPLIQ
jgi:uncharacterized protein